jgi:hypothetical protein
MRPDFYDTPFQSTIKHLGASAIFGFNQNGSEAFAREPHLVPPGKLPLLLWGCFLSRAVKKFGIPNIFCGQIAKETFGEVRRVTAGNRNGDHRGTSSISSEPGPGPPPGPLPEPGTEPEPGTGPEPEPGAGPETVQGFIVAATQATDDVNGPATDAYPLGGVAGCPIM